MYSLIAQLAEQPAVNRQVLGSSPSQGAWRYIEYRSHYLTVQVHLVRCAVASAIGFAGGDIRGLVVLRSENGRGIDDITIAVPGSDPTDLVNVLTSIGGVEVISITPVD
ncbi:MAG: hypothetical protein RL232_90 [Actinomycetota bacterium]